jgi:hypothetical protein
MLLTAELVMLLLLLLMTLTLFRMYVLLTLLFTL